MPIQKGKKMYDAGLMDGEYPEKPDGPIEGTMWSDNIKGTIYDDTILADTGDDYVRAGVGNDTIFGGKGADDLWGETGNDVLHGETGNDILNGGWGSDKLYGGSEDDELYGSYGADRLEGGSGNDFLDGGADAGVTDRMIGGPGNDTYVVQGGSDIVVEAAGEGIDSIELYQPFYTLPANVENVVIWEDIGPEAYIVGNSLNNDIYLNPFYMDNTVYAGDGADNISGGNMTDVLHGQGGDDRIRGGYGNDTLSGGIGKDELQGGPGSDVLTGGADADAFVFFSAHTGHDVVSDFQDGLDRLELYGSGSKITSIQADAQGDAIISFGTMTIELVGIGPNQLSFADWYIA